MSSGSVSHKDGRAATERLLAWETPVDCSSSCICCYVYNDDIEASFYILQVPGSSFSRIWPVHELSNQDRGERLYSREGDRFVVLPAIKSHEEDECGFR